MDGDFELTKQNVVLRRLYPCCMVPSVSAAWLLSLCGCFSPMHTRLPTFYNGYPQSEGMAFQQQDPFPDPSIGPDVQSRPLGFVAPRTPERQAAEQRMFQGLPSVPERIPPGFPRGGLSAPRSVR